MYLRRSKEARLICGSVALTSPDQGAVEQRFCTVQHLEAFLFPARPGVYLFGNACGRFALLNPFLVDLLLLKAMLYAVLLQS